MMNKVIGTKSVDFKIVGKGHGAVNWNGSIEVMGPDGKTINNHSIPKLRGYTNLSGRVKEETGYKYRKEASDINFKENPLYISQNCLRHHLFKNQAFDTHFTTSKNMRSLLISETGLLRGYVVPSSQCKRTSPLMVEDFVDQLGNGNFENLTRAGAKKQKEKDEDGKVKKGEKSDNSFFTKTTFGDTEYLGYGSISIENLQFISLDAKFDFQAMIVKEGEGEEIAKEMSEFIQSLSNDENLKAEAVYHANYVRKGTIYEQGCVGILLNQDAMKILITHLIGEISDLYIQQAKGYMYVDSVLVDYNDGKAMRIKRDEGEISEVPESEFAVYYEAK